MTDEWMSNERMCREAMYRAAKWSVAMGSMSGQGPLGRDAIAALIPHQGAMCLLERVLEWDAERILLATATHRSPDNPLRSQGRLRALHLCEYGAQAMAVHGGLAAQTAGASAQPGLLVSLREVALRRDYIDDLPGDLAVEARRLMESGESWQYTFAVRHEGKLLAEGRAAVMARRIALR
jgi:predicted hotdog family 3-hydroxylacyl-ACP dehydratase